MKNASSVIITLIAFFAVACSSTRTTNAPREESQNYENPSVSQWWGGGNQGR